MACPIDRRNSPIADGARTVGLHLESLRTVDLQQRHEELAQRLNALLKANPSPPIPKDGLNEAQG